METNELGHEKFFTWRKLWWAFVYYSMAVGMLASYVFVQVRILDRDVMVQTGHK